MFESVALHSWVEYNVIQGLVTGNCIVQGHLTVPINTVCISVSFSLQMCYSRILRQSQTLDILVNQQEYSMDACVAVLTGA